MDAILLVGTIVGGVGVALAAAKFGLSIVVDLIPMKAPPKGT